MPIAAVPKYLGKDFQETSPGLRFGMFLKLWGVNRRTHALLWKTHDIYYKVCGPQQQEREYKDENKVGALSDAKSLNKRDRDEMNALSLRQSALAASVPVSQLLRLEAIAVAPFTTGLGNEHPLENGFAFLNPYGLPYLPGSGVKGVLRQAASELASGDWGDTKGWSTEPSYTLMTGEGDARRSIIDEKTKEPVTFSMLDALFGLESQEGEKVHIRGALFFWDVIPQIAGDNLMVEIMTPHQSHYYQQKKDKKTGDSVSPHDSGQPTPISYLTVPPGSGFTFHIVCDLAHLQRLAPELAQNSKWKELLTAAFEHAFQWLGFGAKTAVGYGAMRRDLEAEAIAAKVQAENEAKAQVAHEKAEREAAFAAMTEEERQLETFRELYEAEKAKGPYKAGGIFDQKRNELLRAASKWENKEMKREAAALIKKTISEWTGWPGKKKKQELKDLLNKLEN